MTVAQAYAAATGALAAARRRNREIRRACERHEAPEESSHDHPGSDGYPPCPWSERPREDWCDTCAALTDIPRIGPLIDAQMAALREVLAAGRADTDADTVTRTAVALVKARDEVKRLTKERAACVCDFEWRDTQSNQPHPPLRERGPGWKDLETVKGRECADAPCWHCYDNGDGAVTEYGRVPEIIPIGDADGWCPSCERRQVLHEELRAARRRVVALTSGVLNATRAHMRRTGDLPPTTPKPARPPPLAPLDPGPPPSWQKDPDDVPF